MKLLNVINARFERWVEKKREADKEHRVILPALSRKQIRKQLEQLDTRRRKLTAAQESARVKIAAEVRQKCKAEGLSPIETQQILIECGVIPDCRVATRKAQQK